ncbi:phosphoadenylylsulfate reductase (thioredoxin) [Candidatus Koribacter versatilis Ellin345]|uniref:Adenosine 5'-phosphosulfate reductase n=1 Tax=Koribacter versatilis (strain Ellin345) TaxID=204669 RepID=Q1ITG5_KORVE|nr:phosphoadenylyl-sulfate reductase [Candidatus Koribacter versatilis]ABF39835.1 phosphoadenylylsulfate reductase (thioredoxin) [Candidatus Koribacter versatilis Ellin345]
MSSTTFDLGFQAKIAAAQALVQESIEHAKRPCLTCSFQAEDVVVLDLLRQVVPDIPVLFLDTGYHFAEVYQYRDEIASKWRLNLINLLPKQSVAEQESAFGILYQTAPDRCCGARKVEPLFRALENYSTWFTGLRREQSKSRSALQSIDLFTLPTGTEIQKVSPLAEWSTRDVWTYASAHGIPLLPLYEKGYSSIGCEPCTSLPSEGDPRSGRWGGHKLECGIHIQPSATSEKP